MGRASKKQFQIGQAGSMLVGAVVMSAIVGIMIMTFTSRLSFGRQDANTLRAETGFNDLVSTVQRVTMSPTLCGGGVIGTTPAVGTPVAFTNAAAFLNLQEGAPFENGQMTITQLRWAVVDVTSPTQWTGYLNVQASIGGGLSMFGGNLRHFPLAGTDPRTGVAVTMQMNAANQVTNCSTAANNTQYFSFTMPAVNYNNLGWWNGYQAFPTPFADANFYVTCSVTDGWAPNHDASGESFGFIYAYGGTAAGFNYHYIWDIADWIPLGYPLIVNCVAYHP